MPYHIDYTGLGEQLRELGFSDYKSFIDSDLWKVFSRHLHTLSRFHKCLDCRSGSRIHLHHAEYTSILDPLTIIPLCSKCHRKRHGIVKVKPSPKVYSNLKEELDHLIKKKGVEKGHRLFSIKYPANSTNWTSLIKK